MLLTIHQEGNRPSRTFEQIDGYARHYLEKFSERIDRLSKKDRDRVIAVISLERCRVAFYKWKYLQGLKILITNKVKIVYLLKYIKYLVHRLISHQSYGFTGE